MLESADANRQVDRLIRDSSELLGIVHRKRKIGARRRAPKTSARQLDHARREIYPDATSDVRSKGEEVMTIAATEVQKNIRAAGPGQTAHKGESVFEQPLRLTVLLGRSRCGTLIKEGSDVPDVGCWSGHDTVR